jgi:hypothetical protein
LVTVWWQLLSLQARTELKTPQTMSGKRKWRDRTLPWTRYRKRWTVMSQLWGDWCFRQALEVICGIFQLNWNMFFM